MLICTVSPTRLNFPSGRITMWPPKPRKPPTLTAIAVVLPPRSIITPYTNPRSVPSDDLAVSPTKSSSTAVAVVFVLLGVVGDVACGAAGGALVCGCVAAGGLAGEGGGGCV